MFLSKKLANVLFGKYHNLDGNIRRSTTFTFPSKDDEDKFRTISYAGDDGFILYLIKRIEKLEEKVSKLSLQTSTSRSEAAKPSKAK